MLLGDVVHCPAELLSDDWEAIFDVDRELACLIVPSSSRRELRTDTSARRRGPLPGAPQVRAGRSAAEGSCQWVFG